MRNTEMVKAALSAMPSRFTLDEFDAYFNGNGDIGKLNRAQLSKAIRSQPHVIVFGNGHYKVKGRRVI